MKLALGLECFVSLSSLSSAILTPPWDATGGGVVSSSPLLLATLLGNVKLTSWFGLRPSPVPERTNGWEILLSLPLSLFHEQFFFFL